MAQTQKDRILLLAKRRGDEGFTRWDAVNLVGCFELSSRIGELEKDGYKFARSKESKTARFGDRVTVTRYRLVES